MKPLAAALILAALPGCFSACPTAEDAKAKERIFSPEEPPRAEQEAARHLDLSLFSTDAKVRRRVLRMTASEMRYRLGSFEATTKVDFTWTRGEEKVALAETALLDQAKDGAFRMQVDNDHDFGLELRWVDHTVFVKNRHGHFFERRSDRAQHEAWRDEAVAQLPVFLDLVRAKVHVVQTGRAMRHGRAALKYTVTLADEADAAIGPPPRPAWAHDPVYPDGGPDPSLVHRLRVWEEGKPVAASGEIFVDEATGVPLGFDLRTRYVVPPPKDKGDEDAVLELHMSRDVTRIGEPLAVEVPEHRPFQERPRAVEDPLAWWPKYVPPAKPADGADEGAKPGAGAEAVPAEPSPN